MPLWSRLKLIPLQSTERHINAHARFVIWTQTLQEAFMSITDSESVILLAASNLVTMRAPGQGTKQKDLVEATVKIYKMLKEELAKADD